MSTKYPDCAFDLETLSTRVDAAIVSYGAVWFDRATGKIGPSIYHEIDFRSAVKNRHVDGDTVAWWVRQDAAKDLFSVDAKSLQAKMPLATALHALINGWREYADHDCRPWGNGSSFDISILEHAYEHGAVGMQHPWRATFNRVRDARTWFDAAAFHGFDVKTVKVVGTKHNALDDAKWLAQAIIEATRFIVPGAKGKPVAEWQEHGQEAARAAPKKAADDDY